MSGICNVVCVCASVYSGISEMTYIVVYGTHVRENISETCDFYDLYFSVWCLKCT